MKTTMAKGLRVLLLVSGAVFLCPAHTADPAFVDVTSAAGIQFVGSYGTPFSQLALSERILQLNMGNGAAVGDYDDDGDLDIYLLGQRGLGNLLLRNDLDQGIPGFTDVTSTAGVDDLGMSRVAHFADLDNDGWPDLLLVNDDDGSGNHPTSKIFRNDGDGTFTDVTTASGFNPVGYLRCGAALADYDRDGLLDIYLTNYGLEGGSGLPSFPGQNLLFRNLGAFQFQDVTTSAGLNALARDSFSVLFHDFNGDRRPDLWVALDNTSDEFYWNDSGAFDNATTAVGAGHIGNDMGLATADFDDDGDLDVYATNITNPSGMFIETQFNALHVNQAEPGDGPTFFADEALARGAEDTYWGWGVEFTDVENDGDLDIVAANGFDEWVGLLEGPASAVYATPTVLLVNTGGAGGTFSRMPTPGLDVAEDSRALIAFDYDRDGDEDLLVTNVDQPARLLENVTPGAGHWLEIGLVQGTGGNRQGRGATIRATTGGITRRRDLVSGDSYLAGTPAEVHVGLGQATVVDQLLVEWTHGAPSLYVNVQADRFVRITQHVTDMDLDGAQDAVDCAATDGATWAAPSAVGELHLDKTPEARLSWTAPSAPGALAPMFDVLRGTSAEMTDALCIEHEASSSEAVDPVTPQDGFYYVVRVRNACGEDAGYDSSGVPRQIDACP